MRKYFVVLVSILSICTVLQADFTWRDWQDNLPNQQGGFSSIAASSDGTKLAAINGVYIYTSTDGGATWTQRQRVKISSWRSITSSSDGTKLAAVEFGGYIYTSTDSGATWTEQTNAGSRSWQSITSSSDGTKLAAGMYGGGSIYTSTDGGATWTERTGAGSRYWISMAFSSDGTKLAAVVPGGYIYTSTDSGATWTEQTNAGSRGWRSIASSSDGTKLAAVGGSGYIYTSTDGGATWTEQTGAGSRYWMSIASSSDGTKLAAGVNSGYIYTSTDSGATWTEQTNAGTRSWGLITSSSDGAKLATVENGRYIYTSTDSGVTWTEHSNVGGRYWKSITYSNDGTKLAAVVLNGYIYTSTDSGVTWTERTNAGSSQWYSITSSSDGTKLAASIFYGYIYTSTDGGATWTQRVNAGSRGWSSITSSSDGAKLIAVESGGYIYTSTDSGATWTQQINAGSRNWWSITSSSDGTKLAAVDYNGYIYTSTDSGATWTQRVNAGSRSWQSITSSSDGTKLAAVVQSGYIYASTDSGATWTERTNAGSRNWQSIASSSDGTKLAAVENGGYIYTSADSGATWIQETNADNRNWASITFSSDGTKLAACAQYGSIFLGDSGPLPPAPSRVVQRNGSLIQLINQDTLANPVSIFEVDQTSLNIGTIPDSTFDNVALLTGITGPRLSIPNINPIAATINAAAGAVSAKVTFYNVDKAAIFMNGKQITDRKGNIFPGYNGYIRDVSWNATTRTLTFEITHFTEYGVPVLEGKPFAGSGAGLNIIAQGTNIIAEVPGNSFAGTSLQNTTTSVAKISGLAYETVLSDVPSTINNLYKPLTPGTEYGISFEYINRGNAADTANINLVLTTANVGHYGYSITTDTQAVAPWQMLLFDVKVNANNANAFERATLDATVALPEVSVVSYNAFASAYLGGSFAQDGAYGGVENLSHTFILEAEGYNVAVLSRTATINVPAGYTGSSEDMVPGSKVIYSIAIKNNSTAAATSINVADQIANNCHLYYTDTPSVEGATAWEWKGVTNNNATSADTGAVKFEITIPAAGVVTASYTVTLD